MTNRLAGALLAALVLQAPGAIAAEQGAGGPIVYNPPLRVCASPDDLPYSDRTGAGFENKLAEMLAKDLDTTIAYTWYPDHGGFIQQTLGAGECDLVMGVPDLDGIETSRSYYRSSYVFVTRADRNLTFSSMKDPALRELRIGVSIIGADGTGTPPALALGRQGIVANVQGFPIYGDGSDSARMADPIRAVADGHIDVAAIWGPIAGYYAKNAKLPLRITPITDTNDYLPQLFDYPIAMAVRPGDDDLKNRLNNFIGRHRDDITALLRSYGVPLL